MHKPDERIPASVRFPIEQIADVWMPLVMKGSRPIRNFYTSSTPFMLALAIHKRYHTIKLCGIDLERDAHEHMKDSIFYWMGIAGANHIKIEIPEGSAIMDEAIYPSLLPKRRKRP
jgi:hypothetical protein